MSPSISAQFARLREAIAENLRAQIEHREMDIPCKTCGLTTPAFLRDVRLGNAIICRGCKTNIRLVDHLGGLHRVEANVRRIFTGR